MKTALYSILKQSHSVFSLREALDFLSEVGFLEDGRITEAGRKGPFNSLDLDEFELEHYYRSLLRSYSRILAETRNDSFNHYRIPLSLSSRNEFSKLSEVLTRLAIAFRSERPDKVIILANQVL